MRLLCLGGDNSCARNLQGPHHYLMEEFHKYWDRIDYLCPHHPDARETTLFGNVHFHVAPPGKLSRLGWLKKKGMELLGSHQHQLIAAHDYPPFLHGAAARYLSQQTETPHVIELYHVEGYPKAVDAGEWLRKFFTGFYVKWAADTARSIRVINKTQIPEWLINHGVPAEKHLLLYSSYTDMEIFKPTHVDKDIDLLFVGRLVRNKGLDDIVEAVRRCAPNIRARLVGVGPLKKSIEESIKRHGLENNLVLHGWAKDNLEIADLINRSRALVCASRSEGGPRTTLEAMACGTPVLTTPVGTMPDMIEHRKNGLMIEFNADSLHRELSWLLAHPDEARALGEAGRETVKPFERKSLIKAYAEGYQDLIQP